MYDEGDRNDVPSPWTFERHGATEARRAASPLCSEHENPCSCHNLPAAAQWNKDRDDGERDEYIDGVDELNPSRGCERWGPMTMGR